MIDLHTHILPALDDGPQTMTDAVTMCAMAAEDGISTLVATPHMFCGIGHATASNIPDYVTDLQTALKREKIAVEIRCAAEVQLVENLLERIQAHEIPMYDSGRRYVLLEAPLAGKVIREHLSRLVFELRLAHVTPVIAHPERIEAFQETTMSFAQRIVDQGAVMQVTAASLLPSAPDGVRETTYRMLRAGLIHVIASDAHDRVYRPPILSHAYDTLREIAGAEQAGMLVQNNPARILAGEDVVNLDPLRESPDHGGEGGSWFDRLIGRRKT